MQFTVKMAGYSLGILIAGVDGFQTSRFSDNYYISVSRQVKIISFVVGFQTARFSNNHYN